MDYLELQQRANQIVSKVNNYEAGLAKYEITEADILAEHKYADLYTLRAVMNLLFGSTVDQKCDRTLNVPTDLRLFASTVPMWNTTFNLIPKKYPTTSEIASFVSIVGSPTIDDQGVVSNFSTSNYLQIPDNEYTGTLSTMVDPSVEIEFTITSEITTDTSLVCMHGFIEADMWDINTGFVSWNWGQNGFLYISGPLELNKTYRLKAVVSDNNTKFSSYLYNFDTQTYDVALDKVDFRPNSSHSSFTIGCNSARGSISQPFTQGNINLANSKINGQPLYYLAAEKEYDYEVKSDKHEFISDIDALNNYNLIHLDALENTVTSRDQRIKQGINYSYSSNIADALVTESQVANMFKWNTTDPNTIPNNTMTLNRQVPGIVVYTLGPDYDDYYTSTIGYNPTQSKFNAVNYATPSTYGSWYLAGTDTYYGTPNYIMSQYSGRNHLEHSDFGSCKIFMTGMNYTRGKLESPQQIWQPAEKYGDDNINYGYNRQGQATYHELVFKNRRRGSGASNVDFTPAKSDIPDNDPQGLALRSVLAQQKDFYNGRPWFKELDDLYGANMSKFASNINQTSKIGSGTGSFDRGKFNIVGSPTLSDTGILSNFGFNDYVTVDLPPINTNSEVEITIPKFSVTSGGLVGDEVILLFGFPKTTESEGVQFYIHRITPSRYEIGIKNGSAYSNRTTNNSISDLTKFKISNNLLYQEVTGEWFSMGSLNADKTLATSLVIGYCSNDTDNTATIDLSPLRIVVDGVEVFTAKAVGETYMTDQDFYTNYKLSYDTYAESLNQPK